MHPDSHPDRVRNRHSEFRHPVEDVACKPSLDRLRIRVARLQPITKDPLLPEERVLCARLLVVARLLLPLPPTYFANTPDNTITRTTSATTGLGRLDRRHYDPCSTTQCCVVQRATIVGTVTDDFADSAWHGPHKIHAHVAVVDTRISQSLADDHAITVDTEVQLLPAANAFATMFDCRPLTFAEDGETAAVDHQIKPTELLRQTQRHLQMLTPARERRVIWNVERETHQVEQ
jgi:hypothetical protein